MTSRITLYPVTVEFGDCDPAAIVYFPNFLRWIDASGWHFFVTCGVPSWQDTERNDGIIGTPIVDTRARFVRPATYGDRLQIETWVEEWRTRSFVMRHLVKRAGELLVDATEVRVFARRVAGDRHRIEAVAIPGFIRKLCEEDPAAP